MYVYLLFIKSRSCSVDVFLYFSPRCSVLANIKGTDIYKDRKDYNNVSCCAPCQCSEDASRPIILLSRNDKLYGENCWIGVVRPLDDANTVCVHWNRQ